MGTDKKDKFGLWSIVLLGINSIIGTGIFLLPNRAYADGTVKPPDPSF